MEIGDSSHVDMNNCNCGVPLHNDLVGRNTKTLGSLVATSNWNSPVSGE